MTSRTHTLHNLLIANVLGCNAMPKSWTAGSFSITPNTNEQRGYDSAGFLEMRMFN